MLKNIDHLVITITDKTASAAFYARLGFTVVDAGNRYEFHASHFKINAHFLGAEIAPHAAHVQPGSGDFCFELDEPLAVFVERLTQAGIALELGPVPRHGSRGVMQSVYLRDPDGNLLEFCSYS